MTEDDRINIVADELRSMVIDCVDVTSLLRRIQESFERKDCKILSVRCFHRAFGGSIAAISPITGWCGFGGELTDDKINSFVFPVLQRFRDSHNNNTMKGTGDSEAM